MHYALIAAAARACARSPRVRAMGCCGDGLCGDGDGNGDGDSDGDGDRDGDGDGDGDSDGDGEGR